MEGNGSRPDESVADLHRHLLKAVTTDPEAPPVRMSSHPQESKPSLLETDHADFLKTPGGFRRQFLISKAEAEGREMHPSWQQTFMEKMRPLYSTAGYMERAFGLDEFGKTFEPIKGESGDVQTVLAIVKSFVGTGVTYMPIAFMEGGWAFSAVMVAVVGAASAFCIKRLVDCRVETGARDYASIAERAAGDGVCRLVKTSLILSQFSTVIAYVIFVNQVITSLIPMPQEKCTLFQMLVLMPLSLIRSVHKLEYSNLLGDALIFFGLAVIIWSNSCELMDRGLSSDLAAFEPATCGIFIGMAVFTFEGIPLILPIRESMKEPERFMPIFSAVFTCVVVLFIFFGTLGYLDFGRGVKPVVLNNLPVQNFMTTPVKVGYCVALCCTSPLMFIPASRIVEQWFFGVTVAGERKHSKNLVRITEYFLFGVIALYGGPVFVKFLSFAGALCCAPLAFVYPAWFHLVLVPAGKVSQAVDVLFVVTGCAVICFVLYQSLYS